MSVSFGGGVRIRKKSKTAVCDARPVIFCNEYIYSLKGRTGNVYKPLVRRGEHVKIGQKIAHDENGSYIHSAVSGTVRVIKEHPHQLYEKSDALFIENDGLQEQFSPAEIIDDYTQSEPSELIQKLMQGGLYEASDGDIWGVTDKPIKTLIVDGTQCEPYMTSAYSRIISSAEEILYGIQAAMYIFGAKKAVFVVEGKIRPCVYAVKKVLRYNKDIQMLKVKSRYPQSNELMLVKTALGKKLNAGQTAIDAECVIISAETAYNINRILKKGLPVTERIITVGGENVKNPDNFITAIGTPVSELIKEAGCSENNKIMMGSPITGTLVQDSAIAITAYNSAVISAGKNKITKSCRHCGRCVRACPVGLNPRRLYNASVSYKTKTAKRLKTNKCIGCGACTYACPADRSLMEHITDMKKVLEKIN